MPEPPTVPRTLHEAVMALEAHAYVVEAMICRLFLFVAQHQADPQRFLDESLRVVLHDLDHMDLTSRYAPEILPSVQAMMRHRAQQLLHGVVPKPSGQMKDRGAN